MGKIKRIFILFWIGALGLGVFLFIGFQIIFSNDYIVFGENEIVSKEEVEEIMDDLINSGYEFDRKLVIQISDKSSGTTELGFFIKENKIPFTSLIKIHNDYNLTGVIEKEWKETLLHELGHYYEKELSDNERKKWEKERGGRLSGYWKNGENRKLKDEKGNIDSDVWNNSYSEFFAEDMKAIMSYELGLLHIDKNFNFIKKKESLYSVSQDIKKKTNGMELNDQFLVYFLNKTNEDSLSIDKLNKIYNGYLEKFKNK
ncbi:hypothetical protein [Virgibacillus sp. DJP39]|uniref:hypothetical protein n=1 Tax=Virgibacillus sp. DJP39 TaxID=3409790 RepID=UPI003BB6B9D4